MGETVSEKNLRSLIAAARLDEAVELALDRPTHQTSEQLLRAGSLELLTPFLNRWLAALPPLERLQAAAPLAKGEQLLGCHAAAALGLATELRDFWSFTDGPDAEVAPAIMERIGRYADQIDAMSFDPETSPAGQPDVPGPLLASDSPFDDDPPFNPLPYVPADQNELMPLISSGRQAEALRLAIGHREVWVETRLEYAAVDSHDEATSAFLQAWLPALPPLERLQAASWATSNFQLALVHLPHAYGIGARLLLEAMAAAVSCWADLLRVLGSDITSGELNGDSGFSRRLESYADQLDAMSFEPIPLEPEH